MPRGVPMSEEAKEATQEGLKELRDSLGAEMRAWHEAGCPTNIDMKKLVLWVMGAMDCRNADLPPAPYPQARVLLGWARGNRVKFFERFMKYLEPSRDIDDKEEAEEPDTDPYLEMLKSKGGRNGNDAGASVGDEK